MQCWTRASKPVPLKPDTQNKKIKITSKIKKKNTN